MSRNIELFLINENMNIRAAMKWMSENGEKELFVVNDVRKLIGSLSDGDIRKWILSEGSLKEVVSKVCNRNPVVAGEDFNIDEVKMNMLEYKIESIPVVRNSREIVGILVWDEIFSDSAVIRKNKIEIPIVIMAGGRGSRLDPFTKILPKPLIPIGDKPIIEIIMDKFNKHGIKEFYVSVNHKSKMIRSYFEEMNEKYNIQYIEEEEPLGTAGSLKLLKNRVEGSFLVTNCDTIIDGDYAELIRFHNDNNYDMTLVVSCKHYVIPYGVCEIVNGGMLKAMKEKPEYDLLVNTGMYVIKKELLDLIPANQFFNVNDLIAKAKDSNCKIGAFPVSEKSWIDIGQWEEYHKAIEKMSVKQ